MSWHSCGAASPPGGSGLPPRVWPPWPAAEQPPCLRKKLARVHFPDAFTAPADGLPLKALGGQPLTPCPEGGLERRVAVVALFRPTCLWASMATSRNMCVASTEFVWTHTSTCVRPYSHTSLFTARRATPRARARAGPTDLHRPGQRLPAASPLSPRSLPSSVCSLP